MYCSYAYLRSVFMPIRFHTLRVFGLLVVWFGCSTAVAQKLEEIVVTSQKREQSLTQVPISVMSISGDELILGGASNIAIAAEKVPNLTLDDGVTLSGSSAATSIYIRGIGQSDFLTTTDSAVGLYLDDVYISRSVGSLLDVVDVERVEVLRGPQGTLYGKNTIGGAIKVVTQKPQSDNYIRARVTTGSEQRREAVVTLNGVMSDRINASLTLGGFRQDGSVQRPLASDSLGNKDSWLARFALDITASETISLYITGDVSHANESAAAAILVDTFILCPSNLDVPLCDSNAPEGSPPGQAFLFNNVPPITQRAGGVPGESRYDNQWITNSLDFSYGTGEAVSELNTWGTQATLLWRLPFADLKSITAYRDLESYFTRDADHSPFTIYHTTADIAHSQFSQELQFSGESSSEQLNWLAGIYYLREDAEDDSKLYLASLDIQSGGTDIENASVAGFFNGSYEFNSDWALSLGGRYTREDKSYLPIQSIIFSHPSLVPPQPPTGTIIVPPEINEAEFSSSTYRLGLDYSFSEQILFYSSLASGFKSGGFVQRNQLPQSKLPRFKPETSTTLEFGFRALVWQDRMRMNAAVFHTEYDDIQVRVIEVAGFAPITANAAAAKISGLEWDITAALSDVLHVNAAVGLLNARYTQLDEGLSDITLDSKFVNAPEVSTSIGLQYKAFFGNSSINSRVDWVHRSDIYNDAENTELLKQKAADILNASLQYEMPGADWRIILGGRNLLDEEIIVSGNANRSLGSVVASYQRGRSWYLTVEWSI